MSTARISFHNFVDKQLGKFAHFLIYALLEWLLIFILFIDGFLAFFANEFARFFELKIPCLLCTRIDHVLVRRAADFYYNDSICESHKKDVSYLAYCHDHKKLSHIRRMCDGCLLSFASEKPSESNKSQVGNLHKDIELLLDNDQDHHHHHHHRHMKKDDLLQGDKNSQNRCSCCGEPLKMKFYVKGKGSSLATQAPAPSPRAAFVNLRNERNRSMDLPHSRFAELKFSSNDLELNEDEDGMSSSTLVREDVRAATMRMLSEAEDMGEDRTPRNKFFGIPLTDSANTTPRLAARILKKSALEKTEFADCVETTSAAVENEVDVNESSKGQGQGQGAPLDRKALLSLYMELDEERSASAVAANNAMAMITRLQAEKAEFQMEALQYQRMMEEQAEYDQEALQAANELASKRLEDIKALEVELDVYRSKFGGLSEEDYALSGDEFEYYHDINSQPFSSSSYVERPEFYSPADSCVDGEILHSNEVGTPSSQRGFQLTRFCDLTRLKSLNMRMNFLNDDGAPSSVSSSDNVWPARENKLMRLLLQLRERVKGLETDNEFSKPASPEKEKLLTEIFDDLHKLRDSMATPFGDDDHDA